MISPDELKKQFKTIIEKNGQEFIFQNEQWLIYRDAVRKNTLWIEFLGNNWKPYGTVQSALILENRVLYDWPEYIPKYIKQICSRQKQRI